MNQLSISVDEATVVMHGCEDSKLLSLDVVRPYRRMFVAHGLDLHSLFEGMGSDEGLRFRPRVSSRSDIRAVLRSHMGVAAREMAMLQGLTGCWAVAMPMLRGHWVERQEKAFSNALKNAVWMTFRSSGLFSEAELLQFSAEVSRSLYGLVTLDQSGEAHADTWMAAESNLRQEFTRQFEVLLSEHLTKIEGLLSLWLEGSQEQTSFSVDDLVHIEPYQNQWIGGFHSIEQRLSSILPLCQVRIEHIGSTAVPGLSARNMVDVLLGVANAAMIQDLLPTLAMDGWTPMKGPASPKLTTVCLRDPSGFAQCQLFMVVEGEELWSDVLIFRQGLRSNSRLASAYARLKAKLAQAHGNDAQAYVFGKSEFIQNALAQLRLEIGEASDRWNTE